MKLELCSISAYNSTPIASSENLCGTSNCVFSDLSIGTYFWINENGEPKAQFKVMEKLFGREVFETDSYQELTKWIDDHSKEIQKQIDAKKKEWINSYNPRKEYK